MIAPFLRAKEVGAPLMMNIYKQLSLQLSHPVVGAAVVRDEVAIIRNLNPLMGEAIISNNYLHAAIAATSRNNKGDPCRQTN